MSRAQDKVSLDGADRPHTPESGSTAMTDDWPDRGDLPYSAPTRIRYLHELDLELLRVARHAVIEALDSGMAGSLVTTITLAVARVAQAAKQHPTLIEDPTSVPRATAMLLSHCATPWRTRPRSGSLPSWSARPGPGPEERQDHVFDAKIRALTAVREVLGAVADRVAVRHVEAAVDVALDQLIRDDRGG